MPERFLPFALTLTLTPEATAGAGPRPRPGGPRVPADPALGGRHRPAVPAAGGIRWAAALGRHLLIDYDSRNGCPVNSRRVAGGSAALAPGDRIEVCDYLLVFEEPATDSG
jgi:hypothetical protein